MQVTITFIIAFLWVLPVFVKLSVGNFDFFNPLFLKIYFIATSLLFIVFTLYNVVTFLQRKAPESIKKLAALSIFALIGFLPIFNSPFYGFLGFLGFLSFLTYKK